MYACHIHMKIRSCQTGSVKGGCVYCQSWPRVWVPDRHVCKKEKSHVYVQEKICIYLPYTYGNKIVSDMYVKESMSSESVSSSPRVSVPSKTNIYTYTFMYVYKKKMV